MGNAEASSAPTTPVAARRRSRSGGRRNGRRQSLSMASLTASVPAVGPEALVATLTKDGGDDSVAGHKIISEAKELLLSSTSLSLDDLNNRDNFYASGDVANAAISLLQIMAMLDGDKEKEKEWISRHSNMSDDA